MGLGAGAAEHLPTLVGVECSELFGYWIEDAIAHVYPDQPAASTRDRTAALCRHLAIADYGNRDQRQCLPNCRTAVGLKRGMRLSNAVASL